MNFLDPRQWLLIIVFGAASILGYQFWSARLVDRGDTAGYARAQGEWRVAEAQAKDAADLKTADLRTAADAARKETSNALTNLRRQHTADLDRLRNRPERPADADLPAPAGDGPLAAGCSGAQLYRQDAEFLVGESHRAETVRLELLACYRQYDDARTKLN